MVHFWTEKIPTAAIISVVLVRYVTLNFFAVRIYGESRFWLAIGKIFLAFGLFLSTFVTMIGLAFEVGTLQNFRSAPRFIRGFCENAICGIQKDWVCGPLSTIFESPGTSKLYDMRSLVCVHDSGRGREPKDDALLNLDRCLHVSHNILHAQSPLCRHPCGLLSPISSSRYLTPGPMPVPRRMSLQCRI